MFERSLIGISWPVNQKIEENFPACEFLAQHLAEAAAAGHESVPVDNLHGRTKAGRVVEPNLKFALSCQGS